MIIFLRHFVLKFHYFFATGNCEDWPPLYESTKKSSSYKNVIKDKMTGSPFLPISPKTVKIGTFFGTVTSIFTFLPLNIEPSGHFIFDDSCSSKSKNFHKGVANLHNCR